MSHSDPPPSGGANRPGGRSSGCAGCTRRAPRGAGPDHAARRSRLRRRLHRHDAAGCSAIAGESATTRGRRRGDRYRDGCPAGAGPNGADPWAGRPGNGCRTCAPTPFQWRSSCSPVVTSTLPASACAITQATGLVSPVRAAACDTKPNRHGTDSSSWPEPARPGEQVPADKGAAGTCCPSQDCVYVALRSWRQRPVLD